ncbi:MAG: HEAT repeat domain-containing protein [Myxococcales bacterium]|nr:HEAT repeat domain-containing protein [Myxococcales bacterium]
MLTSLYEIDVATEALDTLDGTAYLTFSNAALRPAILARFSAVPARAAAMAARMLFFEQPGLLAHQLPTVVVTAVQLLAIAGDEDRLRLLADATPAAALQARIALAARGIDVPPKVVARGPDLASVTAQLASASAQQRVEAIAHACLHASAGLLPSLRQRLCDDRDAGVRSEAARALGLFGDAEVFELLHERLKALPEPPPVNTRGKARRELVDAFGAFDGLVRMGDIRALPTLVAMGEGGRWNAWISKLSESSDVPSALVRQYPFGLAGLAELGLGQPSIVDVHTFVPQGLDCSSAEAARAIVHRWLLQGDAADARRVTMAARFGGGVPP